MAENLKEKTIKGIFWGGGLSLLQQGLGLFFSVLIARILSPSDYGMIALLTIFTTLATVIQESGFVFVLTNKKDITQEEYCTVFWFNVITSLIIYIILFIFAPNIAEFYNKPEITTLSRFVFLGFFISSLCIVQNAYLFKEIKVKEKGIATITALIISGITGFIMAINGYCYWGLAVQGLVNTIVNSIIVWYYSPFRPQLKFNKSFLIKTIPDGIRFSIPNLLSAISGNIYTVILGKFYNSVDLGFYSQGSKFNIIGYSFVLNMIRNVSQPVLVKFKDDKTQFLSIFRKLFRFSLYIGAPIMLGLAFISPELILILLTNKWVPAIKIMQILCISGVFIILSSLCTFVLTSLNKTKLYMWFGIINSLLGLVIAVLASLGGVTSLAIATVILEFIYFAALYLKIRKILNYNLRLFIKDFLPIIIAILTAIFLTYIISNSISNIYISLFTKIIITTIIYIALSMFLQIEPFIYIKSIITKKKLC